MIFGRTGRFGNGGGGYGGTSRLSIFTVYKAFNNTALFIDYSTERRAISRANNVCVSTGVEIVYTNYIAITEYFSRRELLEVDVRGCSNWLDTGFINKLGVSECFPLCHRLSTGYLCGLIIANTVCFCELMRNALILLSSNEVSSYLLRRRQGSDELVLQVFTHLIYQVSGNFISKKICY